MKKKIQYRLIRYQNYTQIIYQIYDAVRHLFQQIKDVSVIMENRGILQNKYYIIF